MADSSKDINTLKFEYLFVDGDTRTQTLKNPKSEITTSEIEALQTFMRTNNIIVGDQNGGTFGRIDKVTRINERRVYLDFA